MSPIELTHEQAEALREALLQHDRNSSQNVFDLSKPPKQPYVFQEFPKTLYGHEGDSAGHVVKVNSAEEEQALLAKGYSNDPHPHFDYSRIDRNGMKAAKHDTPPEAVTADDLEAARLLQEKQVADEKKKNRRS